MWNRIQTAANSTTTTLIQTPADLLPRHHDFHKRRRRHRRFDLESDDDHLPNDSKDAPAEEEDRRFWEETFETALNANAVANNGPGRYEICRGKAVPSPSQTPLSGSRDHLPGLSSNADTDAQPQLNPSQRRRRRFQSKSGGRSSSSSEDITVPQKHARHDSDLVPAIAISRSAESPSPLGMYSHGQHRRDAQGVSPPSSPEMGPSGRMHMNHDVSPMEDDADMAQQYMLRGPRPAQVPTSRPMQSKIPPPQAHGHGRRASGQQQPKSSIPTMRRERRKQKESVSSVPKPPRPDYQEQGRQSPAMGRQSPAFGRESPAFGMGANHNSVGWQDPAGGRSTPTHGSPDLEEDLGYGVQTTITSQSARQSQTPSPSFGHRIRQFGRSKPEPIESRPAWNGASGRQAVVDPVRDNKNVAPLNVPPKSKQRMAKSKEIQPSEKVAGNPSGSETSHGSSAAAAMRKFIPSRTGQTPEPTLQAVDAATHNAAQSAQAAQAYPSPPSHSSPAPQAATNLRTGLSPAAPPLTIPSSENIIKRKPPPSAQTQSAVVPPPQGLGLVASPHPATAILPNHLADDGWVQPSSRFSISTRATSAPGSPRQSEEGERPPVPEVPVVPSVMDRRRPLRGGDSPRASDGQPLVISLKSASVSNPITGLEREKQQGVRSAADVKKNDRSASISSLSKALPPAPPEMIESTDRVVILNAKLEGLAHRRNNLTKSIKQMTELMPADRLLQSEEVLRKREDEKKKVEHLKEELSEIQQQEYDLGLKLHRAYKRQDRDADYESGTLWVRRFAE